jgi:citrate synthase
MNAAVGKTNAAQFLPLSLSVLGGSHLGADEVKQTMKFLRNSLEKDPKNLVREALAQGRPEAGDWHPVPGFGSRFGSIDLQASKAGHFLSNLEGAGPALKWSAQLAEELREHQMGWLDPSVAAATLMDLGFSDFAAMGLFQLVRAPGLLAHAVEMSGKPLTAMPFLGDDRYIIETKE